MGRDLDHANLKIDRFDGEYYFLSNFYPRALTLHGIKYPTNEHAYQAQKTMDEDMRLRIAAASTPGLAKKLGRKVELRPEWEEVKDSLMYHLCHIKFGLGNLDLKEKLLATGDAYLEEGNWWGDRYWGVYNGVGQNKLGKILMQIRDGKTFAPHVINHPLGTGGQDWLGANVGLP